MEQTDRIVTPPDRRDLLIAVAVAVAGALFHLLYIQHGVRNWIDLGVAASDAVRILDGDHFGRDFMAPYGPGRYYLTAFWFLLFGTSLWSMNLLYLVLMAVTDLVTYLMARRFLPRSLALVAALLVVAAHGPVHKVYVALFPALFFWLAFRALERRTLVAGLLMGSAGALSGLFRYDAGALALVAALAVTVHALVRHRREGGVPLALGFVAGGLLIVLPAGAAFLFFCDPAWIVDHIGHRIAAFAHVVFDDSTLGELFTSGEDGALLEGVLSVVLLAAPFAVALLGLYEIVIRRKVTRGLQLLLLGLAGIFLLNQWRLIPRFIRLLQAGPFLFTALAVLAFRFRRVAKVLPLLLVLLLLAVMSLYLWEYTGDQSQDSVAVLRVDESRLDLDRGGVWVKRKRCAEMESVVGLVRKLTAPGEPILAGPACPIVYFLADRRNPTACSDPYLYFLNEGAVERMIEAIEEEGVRLYVDWPRPIGGLSIVNAAPRLFACIERRFVVHERVGRFVIMTRR